MNLLHVLFSFRGRIGRQQYWLGCTLSGVLGLIILQMSLASLGIAMPGAKPPAPNPMLGLALLPLSLANTWISFAVQTKRFHDRGRTGLWCLLPFVPIIMMIDAIVHGVANQVTIVQLALSIQPWLIAMLVIGVGFFIDLGCMPSADGPNKYDGSTPPPRAASGGSSSGEPTPVAPSLGNAALAMERAIAQGVSVAALEPRPAAATSFGKRRG